MADDKNGDGFGGSLASAVKGEQRQVKSSGPWEDVGRIRAQTIGLAGFRIWQLFALAMTALMWSYAWFKFGEPESIIISNPMTQFLNIALSLGVIALGAVICYDLYRADLESGMLFALWGVVLIGAFVVISILVPVAVWVLMNVIAIGYAPIGQIITCGWIPFIWLIITAAIVPDFQVGRFAFRHELISQPESSSEKTVLDVTAVRLKQLELDHDVDKWERSNNTLLQLEEARAEIERLGAQVTQLQALPPATRFVPMNHSKARAAYGDVTFSAIPQGNKLSDQEALKKFVMEFETRGTSRERWAGNEEEQQAQTHVSQAQWEKITRALKNLQVLDAKNNPIVTREEAFEMLKMSSQGRPTPP